MMGIWVEAVIDRKTIFCAEIRIVFNDGIAAAVSKNKIVLRYQPSKRIAGIVLNSRQRGRSINVPEGDPSAIRAALQDFFFQQFVKYAHAAVLHYQVGIVGKF